MVATLSNNKYSSMYTFYDLLVIGQARVRYFVRFGIPNQTTNYAILGKYYGLIFKTTSVSLALWQLYYLIASWKQKIIIPIRSWENITPYTLP